MVELHGESGPPLGGAPERGGIAEHGGQRHLAVNDLG